MVNEKQRYKIWMFLAAWTALVVINTVGFLFGNPEDRMAMFNAASSMGNMLDLLSKASLIAFCGVCFVLMLAMNKRQTFQHSSIVNFLTSGVFLWLFWGIFISVGGLALFTSSASYVTLARLWIFALSLFLSVKIAYAYDLMKTLVGIRVFVLG